MLSLICSVHNGVEQAFMPADEAYKASALAAEVKPYLPDALTISSTLRKSSSVSTPTVLNGVSST